MRTIKFRAWDKGSQTMIYPDKKENEKTADYMLNAWCDSENERSILMQFTGLHDKNGKEIYEGDIVKPSFRDGNWFYRIISFEKGMFGYRDKTNSWCIMGIRQGNKPDNKQYEVIGNIYQNPELLTPQH